MSKADFFYVNNDMVLRLDNLQSSTMASSAYLTSSTGINYVLWGDRSTATAGDKLSSGNMAYSTQGNGRYQATVSSTAAVTSTMRGMAIVTAETTAGFTGEWRPHFRAEFRSET